MSILVVVLLLVVAGIVGLNLVLLLGILGWLARDHDEQR